MNIYLHNISCDSQVLDKTSYLSSSPVKITANFNSLVPQDILKPSLIVDNTINPANYNYIYIADLNAYYYLSRYIILSNNRYELQLEKDVLFSNLAVIKESYAIITRSSYRGQEGMRDSTDAFYEAERYSMQSLDTYDVSKFKISDTDNYLLVYYDSQAMGNTGISGLYTHMSNSYDDGIEPLITDTGHCLGYQQTGTNYRVLKYWQVFMLARAVLANENLLKSIKGLYKIPMSITTSSNELDFRCIDTGQHEIRLGDDVIDLHLNSEDTSTIYAPYSYRSRWVFQNITLWQNPHPEYYYENPFSRYEIWCPFVGWVELPTAKIMNKRIKIFYTFNIENGESTCNIYDATSNDIIITRSANAFLSIPISTLNMREIEDRKMALTLNTFIGLLSSAVAIVAGVGNPVAMAGGVISAGKTISNAVTGFSQLHASGQMALLNSNSSYLARISFVLRRYYKEVKRLPKSRIGRPCNDYAQIKYETGYFEANGLILSSNSGICKDEIDEIKLLIEKGCFAS